MEATAQLVAVLTLALELPQDEARRLPIARELADVAAAHGLAAAAAVPVLARDPAPSPEDRRRLARLLGGAAGLQLLESLPDDPDTLAARLALQGDQHPLLSLPTARALIAGWPDAPAAAEARLALGARLAGADLVVEATELLLPLSQGFGEDAATASRLLLGLAVKGGRTEAALAMSTDFITRFPRSTRRSQAEQIRVEMILRAGSEALARGDYAAAIEAFDGLVGELPRDPRAAGAALEAALAARDQGDLDEAERRLDEVMARWPGSGAALEAVEARFLIGAHDRARPIPARAWLAQRAAAGVEGATELLDVLEQSSVALTAADHPSKGTEATVQVRTRNVDRIEVRTHRIDTEAYLRDGGTLEALPDLDVDIIAPDQRWTVEVPDPEPYREAEWTLPVRIREPGLYAVTVASSEHSARAILRVSSTRVVARRVGSELFVAVFDGDRPAPRSRVLVRGPLGIEEHRTDARGLARLSPRDGEATVLVEPTSGPALVVLGATDTPSAEDDRPIAVDLDRPAYRPGDRLGFHLASTAPGEEPWSVWLQEPGDDHAIRHRFPSRHGMVHGELVVPLGSTGGAGRSAGERRLVLMALPPWAHEPRALATVTVADATPQGRSVHLDFVDGNATIEVREGDGRPAAGVPLEWAWSEGGVQGRDVTDATGRVHLLGPVEGVPWSLTAGIPGTGVATSGRRPERPAPSLALRLANDQDRLRPGEALRVYLSGADATLVLQRRVSPAAPAAPTLRWPGQAEAGLWIGGAQADEAPGPAVYETMVYETMVYEGIQTRALRDGSWFQPGALDPGSYRVTAQSGSALLHLEFEVGDRPRLEVPAEIGMGQVLMAHLDGAMGLITAEAGLQTVAEAGRAVILPVAPTWPGTVQVWAMTAEGEVLSRTVQVRQEPRVSLEVSDVGPDWRVQARVLDANGAPLRARVLLRATDPRLEGWAGAVATAPEGALRTDPEPSAEGAAMTGLRHTVTGLPIAWALLEEARLLAERALAQRAREGRLSDNALRDLLVTDVLLGGLGARGSGYGGGGGASGAYGMGTRGVGLGGTGSGGRSAERPQPGQRERALWLVLDSDVDGKIDVSLPRPAGRVAWRIEATAFPYGAQGPGAISRAVEQVSTEHQPVLLVESLAVASRDARARPEVTVVNGGAAPLSGTLRFDAQAVPVDLGPGAQVSISMGERAPGDTVAVRLEAPGVRAERAWHWPALPLEMGGPTDLAALALAGDPLASRSPGRTVLAALSLLEALPALSGGDRARALEALEALLSSPLLKQIPADAVLDRANAIQALALAWAHLELTGGRLEALDQGIDLSDAAPAERVALLRARALAGLAVPDASQARLLRDPAALDAEGRSELARALVLLGDNDGARALVEGQGPQALLARLELGQRRADRAVLTGRAPPVGDPKRPAWIAAARETRAASVAVPLDLVDGTAPLAQRLPRAVDGRPLEVSAWPEAEFACDPCRIAPGEAVQIRAHLDEVQVPGGLHLLPGSQSGDLHRRAAGAGPAQGGQRRPRRRSGRL